MTAPPGAFAPMPPAEQPREGAAAEIERIVRLATAQRVVGLATVGFTSTVAGVGVSTVARLTAEAVPEVCGLRAVLVEVANPRIGVLSAGPPDRPGFTEFLCGETGLEAALRQGEGRRPPRLPPGRAMPARLPRSALDSGLALLGASFDVAVFDLPPVDAAVGLALLARLDLLLIVARAGLADADEIEHARLLIEAAGGRAGGLVLNAAPPAASSPFR